MQPSPTPTAKSQKVTQRKQTFAESASNSRASVITTGSGARDQELIRTVEDCDKEMESQQQWLTTRMKAAAPQALLVAD